MRFFPTDDDLPRPLADIEAFLLRERGTLEPHEIPPPERVRALHLGAYAYSRHRLPEHRDALLRGTARHQQAKGALLPLLRAWREAGIETLVYKGFALAEFAYEVAAERFYGDVDVALRERDLTAARDVALELGWRPVLDLHHRAAEGNHEAMKLRRGPFFVEVHRWLLQAGRFSRERAVRATRAVWERSQEVALEPGLAVRVPDPADALLVGLALHRTSSANDGWSPKALDYPDARILVERYDLRRADVEARAAELGEVRTLARYLALVDPWGRRLRLLRPGRVTRWRWALAALSERPPLELEWGAARLARAPEATARLLTALAPALRVRRTMRRVRDVRALLETLTPPPGPKRELESADLQRITRGAHRAVTLLWHRRDDLCVPRSLVVYRMLRARGHPAVFVSGVRREGGALQGHAWVELEGRPVSGVGDERAPDRYRVALRYPAAEKAPESVLALGVRESGVE